MLTLALLVPVLYLALVGFFLVAMVITKDDQRYRRLLKGLHVLTGVKLDESEKPGNSGLRIDKELGVPRTDDKRGVSIERKRSASRHKSGKK